MIRVFVLDDHELVRRGVVDLIDAAPDMEVVGEASTAAQTLPRVDAVRPDVAVLDMRLPDGDGIDVCRDVRSAHPEIACLILTAFDDDRASEAAVLAGAAGYVLKDIRANGLLDSIRQVAAGKTLTGTRAAELVRSRADADAAPEVDLTLRERQILDLIADGLTNRQIGEKLNLVEKTVKNYVSGLLRKLGMERRTQAAVYRAEQRRS
ncbi:response regulator [Microbacterium sp. Clip185]|uniref:response regulator n=1 Tax=Microbacterium sp. Clip185 TaxID=3025663 RepID=UPI002366B03B|nr:response regulator transcription factor [Microbacterium sp. Clip185]WDG17894.1 response regulator transcription factor [Microbacterium sp. Clip185]